MDWPAQQVREVADGVVAVLQGKGESGVANAGPGTPSILIRLFGGFLNSEQQIDR